MADKKRIIIYLNDKQLPASIPFPTWQKLMRIKLENDNNSKYSLSNQIIALLAGYFKTDEEQAIAAGLQELKINASKSANSLINDLLAAQFGEV